jgi:hypothetical protein
MTLTLSPFFASVPYEGDSPLGWIHRCWPRPVAESAAASPRIEPWWQCSFELRKGLGLDPRRAVATHGGHVMLEWQNQCQYATTEPES